MTAQALVPFSEMFGYSTSLSSATQGIGEFSMKFAKYEPDPKNAKEEVVRLFQEKKRAEAKN